MGMRKRKHGSFRSRKGPKRLKLHSGHTKKDLSSNSQNKYATSSRKIEEKDVDLYFSSSSSEEENPLKQLVFDLRKDSNKTQEDELSDEFVEDSNGEIDEIEEEQEEAVAEIGEEEETQSEEEKDDNGEEAESEEEIDDDNGGEAESEEEKDDNGVEAESEEEIDDDNGGEAESEEEIDDGNGEEAESEEEIDDDNGEEEEEEDEHVEEDFDAEEVEETFASSSEEDSGAEIEEDNEVAASTGKDQFVVHFESVIPDKYVEKLDSGKGWQKKQLTLTFGKSICIWNEDKFKAEVLKNPDNNFQELHVKQKLINNLEKAVGNKTTDSFSPFQNKLFQVINSYQDFYYPQKTLEQSEEVEMVYSLHVINHVLKSRTRVLNHDIKLKTSDDKDSTEEFLDQGLTRPKVVIVVPFRETARRIVSNFIKLLGNTETQTDSKKRFFSEYSLQQEEVINEKKPEDYKTIFAGNTDDHFRIGISLSRKRFKLYTKFYSSDIIIASPLGLRTIIGSEQENKKDYDFLSSIEILILDQTDIFLMQNWEHLMYIMDHLHLQPKESHDCDFSRVRLWSLNGWSKYYRQTIILSSLPSPPISLLFNKYCFNYAGKLQIYPGATSGSICQIALQLPLVFHKVESMSYAKLADVRFNMFIKKILPKFKDNAAMRNTMVFIPSYFDFVRIRNFFNKKEIKFLQINEYSDEDEVAKTRSQFFLGKTQFLLYTERRHFYFRPRIRGVHHVIFYELPLYSHFFSEVCNMMYDSKSKKSSKNDVTGTVLYSKYDAQRLGGVVGTNRAAVMINSSKALHMFVTDSG